MEIRHQVLGNPHPHGLEPLRADPLFTLVTFMNHGHRVRCVMRKRWPSDSESSHRIFLFFRTTATAPSAHSPPHILSISRDICSIVYAFRAALISAMSVRVAQRNSGGGNLLEWVVCICPVPASLAFRLGTVISFGLGRGNPSRAENELVGGPEHIPTRYDQPNQ